MITTIRLPADSGRAGDLQRAPQRGAAGDAGEHARAPGAVPGGVDRVVVGDGDHLVEQLAIEHGGHEPRADALDAMRAGRAAGQHGRAAGLDGDDAQRRDCARAGSSPAPVIVPPVPTPATSTSTRPSSARSISGPVVRRWTSGLAGLENWSGRNTSGSPAIVARGRHRLAHPAQRLGDVHTRAVQPQQALALAAHPLREREHELIALRGAHERERDAGVAAGRLDDRRAARLDPAVPLGGLDHRHADAVLDRCRPGCGTRAWRTAPHRPPRPLPPASEAARSAACPPPAPQC